MYGIKLILFNKPLILKPFYLQKLPYLQLQQFVETVKLLLSSQTQ